MSVAIALCFIALAFVLVLAVAAVILWHITAPPPEDEGFTEDDVAVAWRAFLDDAQTGRLKCLAPAQVRAYRWLQENA
jgi:hypothetical protein